MKDLELIYICALRYALGRKTYVTGVVADYIRARKTLSKKCVDAMIRDIEEQEDYGMDCDKESWMRLLKNLKKGRANLCVNK